MTPEISEFSYGFALTNELVGWTNLKAAPIFPSLIEEGRKGGGYDVKLGMPGVPLYLQFKRADCMQRRSASEIRDGKTQLRVPFYRFPITQSGRSSQHALLLELETSSNLVFYAAPRFHTLEQIDQAWTSRQVATQSIFVRPSAIGSLDTASHHVSYDGNSAYLCSKPQVIKFETAERLLLTMRSKLTTEHRPLYQTLPELNKSLKDAWVRTKERFSKEPALEYRMQGPFSSSRDLGPTLALSTSRREIISTREPSPIREALAPLRQLADDAMKLFDAQLLIVQRA